MYNSDIKWIKNEIDKTYRRTQQKGYPHSMMIFAYLRMKFSSLKMNRERSLSDARQLSRSSSGPPPPAVIVPAVIGTANRTCLRVTPVAASALTAALRPVTPGGSWSSVSTSSASGIIECRILDEQQASRTTTTTGLLQTLHVDRRTIYTNYTDSRLRARRRSRQ